MPEPDELTLEIARALEVDWQYMTRVEAWNVEQVAEPRLVVLLRGHVGIDVCRAHSETVMPFWPVARVAVRRPAETPW